MFEVDKMHHNTVQLPVNGKDPTQTELVLDGNIFLSSDRNSSYVLCFHFVGLMLLEG